MPNNFPKTEIEFLKIIEEIDQHLKDKGILIHFRPLHAMVEFGKRLSISFVVFPIISDETSGNYNSVTLSFHIENWYKQRYGDMLNIPLGPGSVVTLIKGDPWRIWLPKIFGVQHVVCHRNLEKYRNRDKIRNCTRSIADIKYIKLC